MSSSSKEEFQFPSIKRGDFDVAKHLSINKPLRLPVDMKILKTKFDEDQLKNITVNNNLIRRAGKDLPEYTFQYFKNNIILKLNDGKPFDCFVSNTGALTIFNFPLDDVVVLNQLLRFLCGKLHVNMMKFQPMYIKAEDSTQFIQVDRLSTYWDKQGKQIKYLPRNAFSAYAAVKIMGVCFREPVDENDKPSVKLLIHIEQVMVNEIYKNIDAMLANPTCLFPLKN